MASTAVARQPASMMARVDRLDLLLGYLEDMHRNGNGNASVTTASSPSTPAAATGHRGGLVSSDDDSSAASTPTWRRPRPAKEVLEEAQTKGSLIDRIAFLEHRVLKMEEDMEITPANEDNNMASQPRAMSKDDHPSSMMMMKTKKKKKGLKSLVKSCVRGKLKTKD